MILLFFVFRSCKSHKSDYYSAESYRLALLDTLHHFVNKQTKDTVTYKLAATVDQKAFDDILNENKDLKQKLSYYKNIKSVTEIKSDASIGNLDVPMVAEDDTIKKSVYDKSLSTIKNVFSKDTVVKKLLFAFDSSYLYLHGFVLNKDLHIDSLLIPNTQTIVIGNRKNGLFRKSQFDINVENSNKFIHIIGLSGTTIVQNKKWYQDWKLHLVVGFVGGYYLAKRVL